MENNKWPQHSRVLYLLYGALDKWWAIWECLQWAHKALWRKNGISQYLLQPEDIKVTLSNINLLRLSLVFHSALSWELSQEDRYKSLAQEIMMKPIMTPFSHCRQSGAGGKHFIQIKFVDLTGPDMKLYLWSKVTGDIFIIWAWLHKS